MQVMLQQYTINPRSFDQYSELVTLPNRPTQPDPSFFNYACGFYGNLCIGQIQVALGPKFEYEILSGNSTIWFNFSLSFGQVNKAAENAIGGFFSLSKQNVKVTTAVEIDWSRTSPRRTFTLQTNSSNHANVGVQLKDSFSNDVPLFGPSNIVKTGRFVVSQNTKIDGVEVDTTVCVLPFQAIKAKVEKHLRHNKQLENRPPFTETRAERQETQKVLMYQTVPPVFMIRGQSTIVKFSLLGFLACLFLIVVCKVIVFLKTSLNKKLLYPC